MFGPHNLAVLVWRHKHIDTAAQVSGQLHTSPAGKDGCAGGGGDGGGYGDVGGDDGGDGGDGDNGDGDDGDKNNGGGD